jgi:ribose transport system substrate-binding protein
MQKRYLLAGGSLLALGMAAMMLIPTRSVVMAQDPTPNPFLSMGDLEKQLGLLEEEPIGDPETPWLQMYETEDMVDTSMMAVEGPWTICFSNASVGNNWRVSGFGVMSADVEALIAEGKVKDFIVTDAGENADKQISDIDDLLARGDCQVLIISPTSTEQLTPAVEKAAASGIPVVVFDRGVNTTDYTTFIHPIGGYAFGHVGATWLVEQLGGEGNILALRILPGVDVLETRWLAAEQVFAANEGITVVGVEFNGNDPAQTKSIVTDYINRVGQIDGVWMDAGETSVAAYEAFIDLGMEPALVTSEDVNGWLNTWVENDLNSIAPTYPSFQWRTAIAAAVMILEGKEVPKEWILPQPSVTNENVADFAQPDLPDTYYVFSSGNTIEGYLESLSQ